MLAGGGIWYFGFISDQEATVDINQINLPEQEDSAEIVAESAVETDVSAEPVGENRGMKTLAMELIERPAIFRAQLSDAAKKQAADKINESMSMIQQNYDYPDAWYDLAAYRKLIGDYEGAIEAWNFIGLIRPKDYIYLNNLGNLYAFDLKDYKKGEISFLKAIGNNSENINGYLQLATLYEYAYKEKSAEAENILLLGIKFNSKDAALKIALAQYYERSGRKADALKYFEEALKLDPSNGPLQEGINKLKNG